MTDEPKRAAARTQRKSHRQEIDVEPPGHPGEPKRIVTTDHQQAIWHDPVPRARPPEPRDAGHPR
jgi:hypothetical protein